MLSLSKSERYLLLAIGLLLFCYYAMRAAFVPITSDEAGTYFLYIQTADFLPYHAHWDANNHLLNSALSVLFTKLFGTGLLALRLANLLFLPFYLLYTYRISSLLNDKYLRYGLLATFWFAHFFIEFFGLCRGYGMSMALLMAALYYLCRYTQQPTVRYLLYTLLFTSLGQLANMSLLNCFLLINGWAFLISLYHYKAISKIQTIVSFLLLSALPFVFFITYLFELKERGLLYYGNLSGFYNLTLKTLCTLFVNSQQLPVLLVVLAVFFAAMGAFVYNAVKNKKVQDISGLWVYMLVGNITVIILLANLLKVNYPEDRVGMYLFPLFVCAVFFIADALSSKIKYALVAPFLFFVVQFPLVANITYSKLWIEDHIPEHYFGIIYRPTARDEFPPIVSGYKMRTMVWAYYSQQVNGHQNQIQETNFYTNLFSDYIITRKNEVKGWEQYYDEVEYDPVSDLALLARKKKIEGRMWVVTTNAVNYSGNNEYTNLIEHEIDTVNQYPIRVYVEGEISIPENELPNGRIVMDIQDTTGKSISYNYSQLDWLYGRREDGKYQFKFSYIIPPAKQNGKVVVYYWNIDKKPVSLKNGSVQLFLNYN